MKRIVLGVLISVVLAGIVYRAGYVNGYRAGGRAMHIAMSQGHH